MPAQYVRYVSTVFDVCVCSVCIIHGICISPDKTNELWNCCVLCLHGQIGHLIMSDPSAWSVVGAHWTISERCLPDSDLLDLNRHKFSDIFTEFHRLKHRFVMIQLIVPERNTAFQPFCFFSATFSLLISALHFHLLRDDQTLTVTQLSKSVFQFHH